jgi:glycosyltransferase involved in cell wall biosynthesis
MLVADKEPHSPEICAVKNNENSLLFPSGEAKDLAQKLMQMAQEPDMMAKMSACALQTIEEKFSVPVMVKAFEDAVQYAHRNDSKAN